MAFRFFCIAALRSEAAEAKFNAFLRSHRVVEINRRWIEQGSNSFWSFCRGVPGLIGRPHASKQHLARAGPITGTNRCISRFRRTSIAQAALPRRRLVTSTANKSSPVGPNAVTSDWYPISHILSCGPSTNHRPSAAVSCQSSIREPLHARKAAREACRLAEATIVCEAWSSVDYAGRSCDNRLHTVALSLLSMLDSLVRSSSTTQPLGNPRDSPSRHPADALEEAR